MSFVNVANQGGPSYRCWRYHSPYGRLRSLAPGSGHEHQRPHGVLCEIPEESPRSRRETVARPARRQDLRERLRAGLEAVGRTPEDDPQRVPPDALAEGSTGTGRPSARGLLLRGERRAAARVRAPAG